MKRRNKHFKPEHVIKTIVSENYLNAEGENSNFDLTKLNGLEAANIIIDIADELDVKIKPEKFKDFKTTEDLVKFVLNEL